MKLTPLFNDFFHSEKSATLSIKTKIARITEGINLEQMAGAGFGRHRFYGVGIHYPTRI
jgi:hypothetical protein